LRHHARSAAVVAPVADEDKATAAAAALQANTAWLQDCAIRLLCMFALDRCASLPASLSRAALSWCSMCSCRLRGVCAEPS